MNQTFRSKLREGKINSLGRVNEVIEDVLLDKSRLDELYDCLFEDDAWLRMRAADAFEKICRQHPEWIETYVDKMQQDLFSSMQPSIQWHLAQIHEQVHLTAPQRQRVISWLENLLSTKTVDWIVAANAMDTLATFVQSGDYKSSDFIKLVEIQTHHKSKAVIRRAHKLLEEIK